MTQTQQAEVTPGAHVSLEFPAPTTTAAQASAVENRRSRLDSATRQPWRVAEPDWLVPDLRHPDKRKETFT